MAAAQAREPETLSNVVGPDAAGAGSSIATAGTTGFGAEESESLSRDGGELAVDSVAATKHNTSTRPTSIPIPNLPAIPGGLPLSPSLESPTTPDGIRNQAPGILDRRKSLKPASSRSGSRNRRGGVSPGAGGRKVGPPIRVTMADIGAEMKAKDGDTPGETFEDAQDGTPRPTPSAEPAENGDAEVKPNGDAAGLGLDGAAEKGQSTAEARVDSGDAAADSKPARSRQPTLENVPDLPPPRSDIPDRSNSVSPSKHIHGLSGDFAVGTPPPPSTADRSRALEQRHLGERPQLSPDPAAGGLARKVSSGFGGLLGRMGSIRKTARSPPARQQKFADSRRDTGASMASGDGQFNGLAPISNGQEGALRLSLQDQFSSLRRQEEYVMSGANGHAPNGDEEQTPIARSSSDVGLKSPPIPEEEEAEDGQSRLIRAGSIPGPLKSPPLNPNLPPGTASGLTAGPADEPRPVNWDLWQSVVYEGPAAVKRTSGEELQAAIASGIPPALRGVVWQVLAESKDDELENVYRTLKARGTDAEQQLKPVPMSRSESQNAVNGHATEKESVASSRSSVHSDVSTTPATSAMASPPLNGDANPMDKAGKLLAEKQKRDAANLAKLEKTIKRDMGTRTSYSKYTQSAGLQDGLFGVCKAYALFDEGVGYAQGINFIAMPLLFNMTEEEAFTLLVRLMSKFDLRSMFTPDMAGLHLRLYQFERLLEDLEPALYCHLRRRKVEPQLYACQWFLTLFAYRFPLQLVLRVYDLILSEGLTAVLKFGIVLMQRNREALLEMKDMSQLSAFLKEKLFDVYIDKSPSASSLLDSGFFGSVSGGADKELYRADEMVRDACEVVISEQTLAAYTAEWEEQQRTERAKAEELEALRSNNSTLTSRLRALEERTQQQDAEHVTIASELVKLKVDNDQLQDDNEGYKMKVEELQKMVDAQPAEVEEKLKQEMDRIMARNVEVQNENRHLQEEVEELGQAVVQSKMQYAQARADHDALQQRFANIQAAING